ncbi:universal stress protein [Palleronia caenipelagi]|uniref:Universal stress protein n=1 Tax=Palleronia caenipelagi TaxID=2489174 RepID=A0A547QB48_9RHOB|nr:universal stress protein [Palleronia caenipelagi]TRD23580.1 universal stress protein [Palleronia caenipelagi]
MSNTILLPIDLGDPASWEHALPRALHLAEGGVLHIIAVMPNFGMPMVANFFDDAFVTQALHDLGEQLTAWVNTHIPETQEIHPHVVRGRIYDEITAAAKKLNVDVIVMGSSSDNLLGPNAARVARYSECSVFLARG